MIKKLGFLAFSLFACHTSHACDCQGSHPPESVGTIEDQTIFVNSTDCGPNSLHFDLTPYFNSFGQPLSYALSHMVVDGDVSNLNLSVNPFTGMIDVPQGWFGVNTALRLTIVGKNPKGSAMQHMTIYLEPCGG